MGGWLPLVGGGAIFVAMYRNAGLPTASFRIPCNRVVDLGAQVNCRFPS